MASKRRLRRRSCERKVKHPSAAAASATIKSLHARKGYQGRLDVYRCRFCSSYHIGHGKHR